MQPFGWRRLTPHSAIEHRLDPGGALLLRGPNPDDVPFSSARVRDGKGGFVERLVEDLGFVWSRAEDNDGWILRTAGQPSTMTHTVARWAWQVDEACSNALVDERFLFVTIACEVGDAAPDESGLVHAPRTEIGYPRRSGEGDHGDRARDAEDWASYIASGRRGIAHSSHGLMQTLVSTAVAVRPDLFTGVDPMHYRDVLANPPNSIACGAAYAATFPESVRLDPLASRFQYGAGSVRPTPQNRWGAVLFDELVPVTCVAFWNDLACLRTEECAARSTPARQLDISMRVAWIFAAFSCFVLAIAASYATSILHRRAFA
jgi:hypothetical protein